ncbi:MAG: GntR family transcriptional regulator, partial [Cypionkella sp.]
MRIYIDRKLALSPRQQIRGAIEHEISFGGLKVGAALPSVRDLADQTGVAPMTISSLYADLKADGLIETRSGSGTFVADSPLAAASGLRAAQSLRVQIDSLIDQSAELGLRPADIVAMITSRVIHRQHRVNLPLIVMVGIFGDVTASYADRVATQVGTLAVVKPVTIDLMRTDVAALDMVRNADLVLTFSNLHPDVEALTSRRDIISLRFIPSEPTRMALASLDPMARVAVVSRFVEFLPILTL